MSYRICIYTNAFAGKLVACDTTQEAVDQITELKNRGITKIYLDGEWIGVDEALEKLRTPTPPLLDRARAAAAALQASMPRRTVKLYAVSVNGKMLDDEKRAFDKDIPVLFERNKVHAVIQSFLHREAFDPDKNGRYVIEVESEVVTI